MNSGMNAGGGSQASASPLGDRYKVVRELGRSELGQTYLADDLSRFYEPCVVNSFVPPVEAPAVIEDAKALFEQEAGVLRQIDHAQIALFRELLQVSSAEGDRFILVQDYIEGPTYQHLLQERRRAGGHFGETEITQLLYELLPVLSYLHSMGIIHRDISPENIVLRRTDGLPVLIDLGSVKETVNAVCNRLAIGGSGTTFARSGKMGYMPPEQVTTGQVDSTTDLYGLAATLMVLANGQDPQTLHDTAQGSWIGFDTLSPKLGAVLAKMLEVYPNDRFQNADTVLAALNSSQSVDATDRFATGMAGGIAGGVAGGFAAAGMAGGMADDVAVNGNAIYPPVETELLENDGFSEDVVQQAEVVYEDSTGIQMAAVDGRADSKGVSSTYETTLAAAESGVHEPDIAEERITRKDSQQAVLPLLILLGVFATFLGLAWMRSALTNRDSAGSQADVGDVIAPVDERPGGFSVEEAARRQEIQTRREAIGLEEGTFVRMVDQLFYDEYPALLTSGPEGGRKALSDNPEDEPLRIRWDSNALDLLDKFDGHLSQQSLARLGSYSESDRARWQAQVNDVDVSERSLFDLTDAKFLSLFPAQGGGDFLNQPIGQFYYAIAEDKAQASAEGAAREDVRFAAGALSQDVANQIGPGNGKVYTLPLNAGQLLRLNLNTSQAESTLLSVYLPNPTDDNPAIIADSEQTTWSGEVSQTGVYEIVVVNQSDTIISYSLALAVDNVSTSPAVEPERENLPPILSEEESDTGSAEENTAEDDTSTEDSSTTE
ncbi:MAG: protein kinase [Phormidesmis sp.]